MTKAFKIIAFYEFTRIDNLPTLSNQIYKFCNEENIRGTVIIAPEGINGTLAGFISSIDKFAEYIRNLGFINLNTKYSLAEIMPFYRLKVKEKKEIISMLGSSIDPRNPRGEMVSSSEWNVTTAKTPSFFKILTELIKPFINSLISLLTNILKA